MPKLSIIIPIFNKYAFTKSCLNDLFKLSDDHEIIVVDNASSDESYAELSKIDKPNFKLIRNEVNNFHSKGCNQGYQVASSENILFMNNDIKVKSNHENWTDSLIKYCEDDKYNIFGPTMGLLDKDLNFVKEANEMMSGNSYISGWFIAGNKKHWKKLELSDGEVWNEKFPMYFNDGDLCFRARKKNVKLDVVPIKDVIHFGKVSSVQLNVNKLYNEGRSVFLSKWGKK